VPDPVVLRVVVVPATELVPLPVSLGAEEGVGVEATGAGAGAGAGAVGAGVKVGADEAVLLGAGAAVVGAACTAGAAATTVVAGLVTRGFGCRFSAGGCCVRDSPATCTAAGVTPGAAAGAGAAA
jgi:hypothetical protein